MENFDDQNKARIRKIFLAKIQEKILNFFKSKRFVFLAILSVIFILLIIAMFIYYLNLNQEVFGYLNNTYNLPDLSYQGLIIIGVLVAISLIMSFSLVILFVFAAMKKQNVVNKILKFDSIFYQAIKYLLYALVIGYAIFLLFSMFFGLRMINATAMDYVGFYVIFYTASIALLTVIFLIINLVKHIIEFVNSIIYNLDGYDDEFVKGNDLILSLYSFIGINFIFVIILASRYRTIGNRIKDQMFSIFDFQYIFHNFMLWLIILLVYIILLSFVMLRNIDKYTFYVEIDDIR